MFSLNLDKDGRILSATFQKFAPADSVLVNAIPDGNIYEYRYADGEFVHDPLAEPEAEPTPTMETRLETLEEALYMLLNEVTE